MKKYLLIFSVFLVSLPTYAQATREEVQFAISHATAASMFATKAEVCGWQNEGIDLDTLRTHAVTWALTTNETTKKLNEQQQIALIARATNPELVTKLRAIVQGQVQKGICTDTSVPTNPELWAQMVSITKKAIK